MMMSPLLRRPSPAGTIQRPTAVVAERSSCSTGNRDAGRARERDVLLLLLLLRWETNDSDKRVARHSYELRVFEKGIKLVLCIHAECESIVHKTLSIWHSIILCSTEFYIRRQQTKLQTFFCQQCKKWTHARDERIIYYAIDTGKIIYTST